MICATCDCSLLSLRVRSMSGLSSLLSEDTTIKGPASRFPDAKPIDLEKEKLESEEATVAKIEEKTQKRRAKRQTAKRQTAKKPPKKTKKKVNKNVKKIKKIIRKRN